MHAYTKRNRSSRASHKRLDKNDGFAISFSSLQNIFVFVINVESMCLGKGLRRKYKVNDTRGYESNSRPLDHAREHSITLSVKQIVEISGTTFISQEICHVFNMLKKESAGFSFSALSECCSFFPARITVPTPSSSSRYYISPAC